ncbi:hypothetical protein ACFX15_024824 [Malus domestica]
MASLIIVLTTKVSTDGKTQKEKQETSREEGEEGEGISIFRSVLGAPKQQNIAFWGSFGGNRVAAAGRR